MSENGSNIETLLHVNARFENLENRVMDIEKRQTAMEVVQSRTLAVLEHIGTEVTKIANALTKHETDQNTWNKDVDKLRNRGVGVLIGISVLCTYFGYLLDGAGEKMKAFLSAIKGLFS